MARKITIYLGIDHQFPFGGLEHQFFFSIPHSVGNVIIPTDELHHFSVGLVETTNQIIINRILTI